MRRYALYRVPVLVRVVIIIPLFILEHWGHIGVTHHTPKVTRFGRLVRHGENRQWRLNVVNKNVSLVLLVFQLEYIPILLLLCTRWTGGGGRTDMENLEKSWNFKIVISRPEKVPWEKCKPKSFGKDMDICIYSLTKRIKYLYKYLFSF